MKMVLFQIHGDIVTNANVKLVTSTLTAGSATVNNTTNEVSLNATEMTQGTAVAATLEQNVVEFENLDGFCSWASGRGRRCRCSGFCCHDG